MMRLHRLRITIILLAIAAALVPVRAQTPRDRAIALVKQAEAAFYAKKYDQTITLCRAAIKTDAKYTRAYTWLGATYAKQGKRELARAQYGRILDVAPGTPDAAYARKWLLQHDAVRIVRQKKVIESLPYDTRIVTAADVPPGQPRIDQKGRAGLREVTYAITTLDGYEIERKVVQSRMRLAPVPEIVAMALAPKPFPTMPAIAATLAPPVVEATPTPAKPAPDNAPERGVPAETCTAPGALKPLPRVMVQHKTYGRAFGFPIGNALITTVEFNLDGKYEWFEAEIAIPDDSLYACLTVSGSFNKPNGKRAFADLEVKRGAVPILLRVHLKNVRRFFLSAYGDVVLIHPRLLPPP